VPLLTREGEVESPSASSAASCGSEGTLRSPIVINELLEMGEDLKKGVRSIKEVVTSMKKRSPMRFCRTA